MSFLRRRIYCHYCNSRSPYARSAGIRQFQCDQCEAINTLDSKGDIDDTTPAPASPTKAPLTYTRPLPASLNHQREDIFCRECQHNQLVHQQTLANYLPDENDPTCQQYEDALPQFKAELEQRHPQICAKCAPRAQHMLNRADVYAASDNMSRLSSATKRAGAIASRDDWSKRSKRMALDFCGLLKNTSLVAQVAWHAYEMLAIKELLEISHITLLRHFQAKALADWQGSCTLRDYSLSNPYCRHESISTALSLSLLLIWHNPDLRHWYHDKHRIVAITGQNQYYMLQSILLVVRMGAFYYLSTKHFAQHLSAWERLAFHGLSIAFMLVVQLLSNAAVEPVVWKLNMKITPKPGDGNIFGRLLGSVDQPHTSRSSEVPPRTLLNPKTSASFPIANLAPARGVRLPTPPYDENVDAMDIDSTPPAHVGGFKARSRNSLRSSGIGLPDATLAVRSTYNYNSIAEQPSGWGAVRNETFAIQSQTRQDADQQRREQMKQTKPRFTHNEQSPFRGCLPQAPMSMERRLRNPPTQVYFKKTPLSEQQNFLGQMREGIRGGTTFASGQSAENEGQEDDFETEVPGRFRTKGELELRQSTWQLPSDGRDTTGLEDMFGGSFNIEDRPAVHTLSRNTRPHGAGTGITPRMALTVGLPVAILLAFSMESVRRPTALWLLRIFMNAGILPSDDITAQVMDHDPTVVAMGNDYTT